MANGTSRRASGWAGEKVARSKGQPGHPALAGCGKTLRVRRNFTGLHVWDSRSTPRRMLKKAVQQGRSERRGEAYASVR